MIGNDIVSVDEIKIRNQNRLERYLHKICLSHEKNWCLNYSDPRIPAAWLWSLKESAYKIWSKKTQNRKWNPKSFSIEIPDQIDLDSLNFHEISGKGFNENHPYFLINSPIGLLAGKSFFYQNYFHSYVSETSEEIENMYWELECFYPPKKAAIETN